MFKRFFSVLLSALLLCTTMGTALADVPNTAEDKLAAIETTLYGEAQTGALLDRINRLERDYGVSTETASGMMDRINVLYDTTYDNSASPSMITQMNALEWAISHSVSMDSMQNRVTAMENNVNGKVSEGFPYC